MVTVNEGARYPIKSASYMAHLNSVYNTPYRSVGTVERAFTLDELIAEEQRKYDRILLDMKPNQMDSDYIHNQEAKLTNLKWIRDHGPQTVAEKKAKEIGIDDIADLLLDLTGYGAAIAQIMPTPAVRAGGRIAGFAASAGRYAQRGQYERASRELSKSGRELYYNLGQNWKSRKRR